MHASATVEEDANNRIGRSTRREGCFTKDYNIIQKSCRRSTRSRNGENEGLFVRKLISKSGESQNIVQNEELIPSLFRLGE
jgi:hypothetical protein